MWNLYTGRSEIMRKIYDIPFFFLKRNFTTNNEEAAVVFEIREYYKFVYPQKILVDCKQDNEYSDGAKIFLSNAQKCQAFCDMIQIFCDL